MNNNRQRPLGSRTLWRRPAAVILAGGKGTRLAPLTDVLPKPLMPLGGAPIIDTLIRQLKIHGWREVTLAVGHMADLLRTYCGSGARWDMRVRYVQETQPLGTVGPLAYLPPSTVGRTVLVMNGDLMTTLPFGDFVRAHRASGAQASMALFRRDIKMEFGVVEMDGHIGEERRIVGFREKPEIPATVSMGVYLLEPEAVALIHPGERLDLPDLILRMLDRGMDVAGYNFDGYWLDIGRHNDYQQANADFERLKPLLLPPVVDTAGVTSETAEVAA